jgi:ketosteroid isomerase-like protein
MSEEKADLVRSAYERLNQRDIEGLVALCDETFLLDMSERVFNPDTYRGHDGIRRFCADVDEAWETYHWTVEEALAADDSVVAMLHCQGTSRHGGPQVDWRVAWLWIVQGGKALSIRFFRNRADALEAAGLSE